MSASGIVHLHDVRSRRERRLRTLLALHAGDPDRREMLALLWKVLQVVGGDRAAAVWVDEYGSGLIHADTVLDLASDRPRRDFSPNALQAAWEIGIPGLLDVPDARERGPGSLGPGVGSAAVVALGSDGFRSWFLTVDSASPRRRLPAAVAEDLMFLAGEIAAAILHRDLLMDLDDGAAPVPGMGTPLVGEEPRVAFAGWPVLEDLPDGEEEIPEELNGRIMGRFLVARILRSVLEDGLVTEPESLAYQLRGVRREIAPYRPGDPEKAAWEAVLAALDPWDPVALTQAILELGQRIEAMGHYHGALEFHGLAYQLAVSEVLPEAALDAARFRARVLRKMAKAAEALYWYDVALELARVMGDIARTVRILDGMAAVRRETGELDAARELLLEALELGESAGDSAACAIVHHDLMALQKRVGDLESAVVHGWQAVRAYPSEEESLQALMDLAGVFQEAGDLQAAEDAYAVVARRVKTYEYRVLALDGLAYISALRGDAVGFERWRSRTDETGWRQQGPPIVKVQVLYYRGLSYRALGHEELARRWLETALRTAEEHRLGQMVKEARLALAAGAEAVEASARRVAPVEDLATARVLAVRRELRELRVSVVGTAA